MPKISDLNELNQISDDDVLVINALVDGKNTTLKIKRSVLLNGLAKQSSLDITNTNITMIPRNSAQALVFLIHTKR